MNQSSRFSRVLVLVVALLAAASPAEVIPVDLPPPGDQPPATDKPVKVYILSGQSNMLGFGAIEPRAPFYSRVFLSADPSAKQTALPVNSAALFPMKITGATGAVIRQASHKEESIALGSTTARLPELDAGEGLLAKAQLTVPYDGEYHVHVGSGSSSHAVAQVAGAEVYRKGAGDAAVLTPVTLKKDQPYPLEITYTKGGSCALWLEKIDLKPMGDLRWVVNELGRFQHVMGQDGEWVELPDVMLCDAYMGKGKAAPHGVAATGNTFGPELGFGFVMGAFHDEPVIVMKADIGNRSLGWDILPPGSERYTFDGKEYPGYGEEYDADGKVQKFDGDGWYAGKQYDDYTESVRAVLDNFGEKFPQYADQGYEVAGFVWWQGHKDGPNAGHNARYEQNLVNLIKAWRKEFDAPNAPWAIATVGFEGEDMPEHYVKILEAQKAVADPERHPELAGTVKTIDTRPFWRSASVSPKNQGYHYNHNAETYMLTGDALGRAMAELKGGKVEYPDPALDPSVAALPAMSPYGIKAADLEKMAPALRPIMLDALIPAYVTDAPGTPGYRRNGLELETILSNTAPEKPGKNAYDLTSQLDKLIEYYNLAGVHDYDWKPVDPGMQEATWHYTTLNPGDEPPPGKDRYREVSLPKTFVNFAMPGFDPKKAGWRAGQAPFGQKNGEQVALIPGCSVSHCGCHITPNTLWDQELLLMRQTFKAPTFDPAKRYRVVVGGAGHGWSGEGFALYLDGIQVAEMTAGYYKKGGAPRGAYLYDALKPALEDGEVTIAVKAFLRMSGHRGKPADPSGHISVWFEEATLPPAVAPLLEK